MILPQSKPTWGVAGFLSPILRKGDGNERLQERRCLLVRLLVSWDSLPRIHRTHQQERSHGCRIHPQGELAEGRAGIVHRDPVPKFEDFVKNEFMPWSEKQHETHPRTHQYYRMSSKPLIASLGKLPLDGITTAYVERFKMIWAENVSPASTNRDMAALIIV